MAPRSPLWLILSRGRVRGDVRLWPGCRRPACWRRERRWRSGSARSPGGPPKAPCRSVQSVRSWRQGLLDGGVAEAVCVDGDAVEVDLFQFSKIVRDVRGDDDLLARSSWS